MKKKVIVKQRDFMDCGVSCMQSIVMHYGGYITLEKLREITCTSIDGTTAFHIVGAFRKIGFDAYAYKETDIKKISKLPVIVHLKLKNGMYHFAVLYEINNNRLTLMDPSVGKRVMNIEEFSELFTSNIIAVIPKDKDIIQEKRIKISNFFLTIIKKEKRLVIKLIVLSFLFSILTVINSYYFKICSDNIESLFIIKKLIFLFLNFTLIKILIEYARFYYENYLNLKIDVSMYNDFINHLFNLPSKNIKSRTTGEIMTRISELNSVKELFSTIFITLFLDILLAIISLIILGIINFKLWIILIIFIIVYLLFGILVNNKIYQKILLNINHETNMNSVLTEKINLFTSIKNLNIVNIMTKKIENNISNYLIDSFNFVKYYNKINFSKNLILDLSFFIINSYGFIMIYNNQFSLILLVTFNLLISFTIEPIKNIINLLPRFNYIKASFEKISEFLSIEEERFGNDNRLLCGDLKLVDLSYSYDNYNSIIRNFDYVIKMNDKVFLKGHSGSGKSTLCNLLYKNILPNSGSIYIEDKNYEKIDLGVIRNSILYINQNEEIINGTIKENIILNRNINNEEFLKVSKVCELDSILKSHPAGYETQIDPFSKNISGGEKQRIILARGLLKKSNIFILDEVLSEVDYNSEKQIIKNILNNYIDKTIIYISHKNHENLFDYCINMEKYN